MDVRCDKCGTEYEFDENRIGPNGVTVKCTNCEHVFKVKRPARRPMIPRATTTIGAGPKGKEWLVRKPDGQMIAFRELTTLQKWIVEGRIQRDDEISKNGETWKRLGNIMELEPFFSVFEKAQTLNSLIEQNPVELRGSELLAAVNPLEGGHQPAYPIPSQSQILQADPLPSMLPSQIPQPLAPKAAAPRQGSAPPTTARPVSAPHTRRPPSRPSSFALESPTAASMAPPTNFAGPGALERDDRDIRANSMDFSVDVDLDGDDPVAAFERNQRNRRAIIGGLIITCLGLGASIAVAMYGPADNPLRKLAVRYELIPSAMIDDGADAIIEEARREADKDTIASQGKAIELMGRALIARPSDLTLLADRVTQTALLADAHQRWADDIVEDAKREAAARGASGEPAMALIEEAGRHQTTAKKLAYQAEGWLDPFEATSQATSQFSRAHATLAAAQRASNRSELLAAARTAAETDGRTDPVLLYLEASDAIAKGSYASARSVLNQAMTARPSFQRAAALSARLQLLQGNLDGAEITINRILKAAPGHEEAERLRRHLTRARAAKAPPPPPKAPSRTPTKTQPAPKPVVTKGFDYWMNRGDRLRRQDRTMKALNAYGRAAELKPDSAEVHVGKGWCLLDIDRPHPALAAFDRALSVNSRFAEAHYGRGEALLRLNRKEDAISAYRIYLNRAPAGAEQRVVERRLTELSAN